MHSIKSSYMMENKMGQLRILLLAVSLSTLFYGQASQASQVGASFVFGDNAGVVDLDLEPVEDFQVGVRGMFTYAKDGLNEDHAKIDDWLVGAYIKYPLLSFVSEKIPVEGEAFAGASLLYAFDGAASVYFLPEVGFDMTINDNLDARVSYLYNKRDEMFGDKSEVMFGVRVKF